MSRSIIHRIVAVALLIASLQQVSLAQDVAHDRGAQNDRQATIISETRARLTLRSERNSKLSEAGDIISATLAEPVYVDGQLVLLRGTEFRGRIIKVALAKRGQRSSRMSIEFERIIMPSGDVPISAQVTAIDDWDREESIKADSKGELRGGDRGEKTIDNTRRGGQIGLAGGFAGAALGGAAGASGRQVFGIGGASLAVGMIAGLLLTKGNDIRVRPGAFCESNSQNPLRSR